ncbi:hypothetical protein LZ30DRAFT_703182 [Colletotrichum cereale]|nr:hypothetical protein LZ30DRAFT_703182 [Colletotrichum cereale]
MNKNKNPSSFRVSFSSKELLALQTGASRSGTAPPPARHPPWTSLPFFPGRQAASSWECVVGEGGRKKCAWSGFLPRTVRHKSRLWVTVPENAEPCKTINKLTTSGGGDRWLKKKHSFRHSRRPRVRLGRHGKAKTASVPYGLGYGVGALRWVWHL